MMILAPLAYARRGWASGWAAPLDRADTARGGRGLGDPDLPVRHADALGRLVASAVARRVPAAGSLTWTSRAAPG